MRRSIVIAAAVFAGLLLFSGAVMNAALDERLVELALVKPAEQQLSIFFESVGKTDGPIIVKPFESPHGHHHISDPNRRIQFSLLCGRDCVLGARFANLVALEIIVIRKLLTVFDTFPAAANLNAVRGGGARIFYVEDHLQLGKNLALWQRNYRTVFSMFAIHTTKIDAFNTGIGTELPLCRVARNSDLSFGGIGLALGFRHLLSGFGGLFLGFDNRGACGLVGQISNYSSRYSSYESGGSYSYIGPQRPNLMPPIIALVGLIIAITGVPVLVRGYSPFFIIPSVSSISFGSAAFGIWLVFWLLPPQHCYAPSLAENVSAAPGSTPQQVLSPRRICRVLPVVVAQLKLGTYSGMYLALILWNVPMTPRFTNDQKPSIVLV